MKNINEITIPVYFQMPKCGSTFVRYSLLNIASEYGKNPGHVLNDNNGEQLANFGLVPKEGKTSPLKNSKKRQFTYNKKTMELILENFHVVYIFITTHGINCGHNQILKYFQNKDLYKIISHRDPFQYEVSLYDYITSKKSSHEDYHNIIEEPSFQNYVLKSKHFGDSLLIRAFAGVGSDRQITDEDYKLTKQIIQKFHKIDVSTQNLQYQLIQIFEICYGVDNKIIECFPEKKENKGVKHTIDSINCLSPTAKVKFLERKHYDYLIYYDCFLQDRKLKILSKIQEDKDFIYNKFYFEDMKLNNDVFTLKNTDFSNIRGSIKTNGKRDNSIELKISHTHFVKPVTETGETALVINIPYCNNYGHCLHDVLPKLMWEDINSKYDKIYTCGSPMIESLIDLLDIKFKKTIFVDQDFQIHSENIILENHTAYHIRDTRKNKIIKECIDKKISNLKKSPKKLLIYCSRNDSSDVCHGRKMNQDTEDIIIDLLQTYCKDNDLTFFFFNGQENGETMSHEKQLELFRCAKIVIGPHGSAMANVVYLDPKNKPRVCEFTSGTQVQVHGDIFNKHYNALFGFVFGPEYQYYLIPFTKDSTPEVTDIDIDNLMQFMRKVENDQ